MMNNIISISKKEIEILRCYFLEKVSDKENEKK